MLELILFDEMTKQVAECTEEILEMIKGVLMDIKESFKEKSQKSEKSTSPGALGHHSHQLALSDTLSNALFFEEIDSGAYFSFSKQWEELQQLLQILDDDLGDTIDKISSWEVRERDRGLEKPRWTKKDEQRYRPTITRLTRSNRKNTRQIERVQANVQSLRTALLNTRDYIREELSLRGAEDTRYFTYVTVIFLPLGFATSIFSTSDTPQGLTSVWMVVAAVIALLLTGTALHYNQQIANVKHRVEGRYFMEPRLEERSHLRYLDQRHNERTAPSGQNRIRVREAFEHTGSWMRHRKSHQSRQLDDLEKAYSSED